jgi:uncharacterized protein YlaI
MNNLTDLQQQVFDSAKKRLENKPWYRGVCMDCFPTDGEIMRHGVDECADRVIMETEQWDMHY